MKYMKLDKRAINSFLIIKQLFFKQMVGAELALFWNTAMLLFYVTIASLFWKYLV